MLCNLLKAFCGEHRKSTTGLHTPEQRDAQVTSTRTGVLRSLEASRSMSLDAGDEIVSGIVSLDGVVDMSVLNNDGFGVKRSSCRNSVERTAVSCNV